MKRNSWKLLVVLALAIAVIVVMNAKRTPDSSASQPSASAHASPRVDVATDAETTPGEAVEGKGPRLVDLGSKTCVPCKMMEPILDELREANAGAVPVIFYDVSEQQEKAREYGIRVIPTQIFFDKDGKEFFRHEGFMPKEDIIAKFGEKGIELRGGK